MESIEQKKKNAEELFDIAVLESNRHRTALEKKIAKKAEKQVSNMLKVKEKCHIERGHEEEIYRKKIEIDENRQLLNSENALQKYNSVQTKTKELSERITLSVEDHRKRNEERFYKRDDGLKVQKREREQFLRRERDRKVN